MPFVCIHVLPHSHPLPWNALRCASSAKVVGSDCGSLLPSVHWHSVARLYVGHSPSPAHAPRTVCTFRAVEFPHPGRRVAECSPVVIGALQAFPSSALVHTPIVAGNSVQVLCDVLWHAY
jgi:hypothetical protein